MDYVLIEKWWEEYQADPRSSFGDILSGMRQNMPTAGTDEFPGGYSEKVSKSQRVTGSCQYWIKGLSAVCMNWDNASLKCTISNKPSPSGYGIDGSCDRLGRRSWCDGYMPIGEDDLEQFVCIAPCIEKSGLGRQITNEFGFLSYRPLKIEEIQGYNPGENGVGQCDGWGLGRGNQAEFSLLEQIYDYPIICRQYRPHQMGFGAVQPRPFHGSRTPGKPFDPKINYIPDTPEKLHDGSAADPLKAMDIRLPFTFQVYNARSMYQKCAHWKNTDPAFFRISYIGSDPSMYNIMMDGVSACDCEKSDCSYYKDIEEDRTKNLSWLLADVWAPYGGVVCNGAKPECPCYSGKWTYCNDNNMRDGMRVTADQIFELRFWASDWASQDEYNAYYLQKPGPTVDGVADESTADLFTFKKWDKFNATDPNESTMVGVKHHMCMPAPLNMRDFIPSLYIEKKEFLYPKLNEDTGTSVEGISVRFPTLARALEDPDQFIPGVLVIYPYYTIDPWNVEICNADDLPNYCYHDSNLMSDPLISVIGQTILNKTVYVINTNLTELSEESFSFMDEYIRPNQIPPKKWREFCETLQEVIKSLESENTAIFKASSNDTGFFEVEQVKLELNKMNDLYVVCKYDDKEYPHYTYRTLRVQSRYWAGLIEQTHATHNHEGDIWYNYFPLFTSPHFSVAGEVQTTRGEIQTVFSTYALYVYGLIEDVAYYAYCINEYTETVDDVEKWVQVGSSGYIWAEIDNTEISYLWKFKIENASILFNSESKSKIGFCGTSTTDSITLEVIYPNPTVTNYDSNDIYRHSIPPNAVLLKAPEPLAFFNSSWTLSITYSYQRLDTFMGEKVVWPVNMGAELASNQFAVSPYQVMHEYGSPNFNIDYVGGLDTRGSIKVMAFIGDPDTMRIQAAVSTKLLLQGYNAGMRSVDIRYAYSADAIGYDLEPSTGFFTWRGAPSVIGNSQKFVHSRNAKCGDHECAPGNCIGPVWFPFKDCTTVDFYNVMNGAAECTMPISEASPNIAVMGFAGWRYVIADRFEAWVTPGGNWAANCGTSFYYHYSVASKTQRFVGEAKKKAKVDKWYYSFMSWALPPFGNKGRGFVERYVTRDFASHIDISGPLPQTSYRQMPMVFDKEDLFADLNPFANPDEATPLHEPFSHFSMMSNYTADFISEEILEDRFRFEDIIEPVYHGNCMYPHPLIPSFGGTYRVIRYGFKNNNHVWAWPELWKAIERDQADGETGNKGEYGQFVFLDLVRPEYYFDYNKEEHRLITDEGSHTIIFDPPEKSNPDEESDSKSKVYPSISIDGAYPRFFKLVYDEYTAETVEWKDECTSGEEGSSGGGEGEGGSIYEKANNGANLNGLITDNPETQWLHDFDTIFDANAEAEPNEDRKAFLGKSFFTDEDIYAYYNRGLIAYIPRNRLQYLPVSVSDAGPPMLMSEDITDHTISSVVCYWEMTGESVPLTIKVTGYWGPTKGDEDSNLLYSIPSISVVEGMQEGSFEYNDNGFPEIPEDAKVVDSSRARSGKDITIDSLKEYSIKFDLPRIPDRMIRSINYFFVTLSASPGSETLYIVDITAEVGHYVRAEETIKVWERRYYVSQGKLTELNADGPDTDKYRSYQRDMENAGQYFPFEDKFSLQHVAHEDGKFLDGETTDFEEGGKVISKLTMVGFTKIAREDEILPVTMDTLKEVELEPQHALHVEMFNLDDHDVLDYSGVQHPAVREWLTNIDENIMRAKRLKLQYKKIDWEHNEFKNMLNQEGEFITPGGHYFLWSDNFTRERCYLFGIVQNVYQVGWVHEGHAHGGGLNAEGDVETTWTAGQAYAGWGRLHYYTGRLASLGFLGQSETGSPTDSLTGAKNFTYERA